eukprot:Skav201377  [mRNA]  locus=scaffold3514:44641:46380:- [translate_table: standard]
MGKPWVESSAQHRDHPGVSYGSERGPLYPAPCERHGFTTAWRHVDGGAESEDHGSSAVSQVGMDEPVSPIMLALVLRQIMPSLAITQVRRRPGRLGGYGSSS